MDEKTLEALKASIAKWQENITASIPRVTFKVAPQDCALCNLFFFTDDFYDRCLGCPIQQKTGKKVCKGTPYTEAAKAVENWDSRVGDKARDRWREKAQLAARAEVDFLKSLLPTGAA